MNPDEIIEPIYLDNAATSHPKPPEVQLAVQEALTTANANPGRSGHQRALRAARVVLSCREELAQLLGAADPFCMIHCFNCTDALNLAIKGSLCRGDHVVTSCLEHNSVLRVLKTLEQAGQITLTLLTPNPDGVISPEQFRQAIGANTRLAVLTQASNVLGVVQPVAAVGALCRELGIRYLVDGAQAAGTLPVNVQALGCDLYAFPGHKALLGPQGTGGLYIAPGVTLHTLREGGTGSSSESMLQPQDLPERYESGTVNLPGIAGLGAGVRFVQHNQRKILLHERTLTQMLLEGLLAIPEVTVYGSRDPAMRVGVVSFNLGDFSSSTLADALDRRGIAVRGGLHCAPGAHQWMNTLRRGAVRVSVGQANTEEEIESFLKAITEFARQGIQD